MLGYEDFLGGGVDDFPRRNPTPPGHSLLRSRSSGDKAAAAIAAGGERRGELGTKGLVQSQAARLIGAAALRLLLNRPGGGEAVCLCGACPQSSHQGHVGGNGCWT